MDESRVTRYATEKYVDKNNIKDSEIDEVFDELSMKPRKIYKINYDYDKGMCYIQPTPPIMYGDDEVAIHMKTLSNRYFIRSINVMQGEDDITNNAVDEDNECITLNSINNDITIKLISDKNKPL